MDISLLYFSYGFLSALLFGLILFGWLLLKKDQAYNRLYQKALQFQSRVKLLEESLTLTKSHLEKSQVDQANLQKNFEAISSKLLYQNSKAQQVEFQEGIKPFWGALEKFSEQVQHFYHNESKERYSLTQEIEKLRELNRHLGEEAQSLSKALKGDQKLQGVWGEMILERILENSGLVKDREYKREVTLLNSRGERHRPDAVIYLPTQKEVIIDAKLTLKSYVEYSADQQHEQLERFLSSIKNHIITLYQKQYHNLEGVRSLDFILMFIPIEGAFALLHEKGSQLIEEAYKKQIIIVSPSTLMAVLRVIENGWRFDYQDKNAKLIAKKATQLLEKFSLFVKEMEQINTHLAKAQESYDLAYKRLSTGRGNLIQQSRELQALQTSAPTDEVSQAPV